MIIFGFKLINDIFKMCGVVYVSDVLIVIFFIFLKKWISFVCKFCKWVIFFFICFIVIWSVFIIVIMLGKFFVLEWYLSFCWLFDKIGFNFMLLCI